MPSVPRLTRPQVQESVGPQMQIRAVAGAETFSSGFSPQMAEAGLKMYQQAKKNGDELAIMEADKKLAALENKILYDKDTGAFNKKGKDAFGAVEEVETEFNNGISEIEGTLSNEEQKMAFRKRYYDRQTDVNRQMSKHVASQIQEYDKQETEAFLAIERNSVAANPYDTQRVMTAIERQKQAITSHATRNGLPPEWIEQKTAEIESKTHSVAIDKMLSAGNDMSAQEYYNLNKDKFFGEDAIRVGKVIEEGSIRGNSQRKSDEIMSKGLSLTAAIEEVKKIEDPKLRDATVDRVRQDFALKEAAKRDQVEKMHINATNIIDKTGRIEEIPPQQWAQFSLSERSALKTYARNRAEGIQPATDWNEYYNMKTMASTPTMRDQFMQINLYEHRNKFADSEFKEMVNLQTGLRTGDEKAGKILDGYQTDKMIVDGALQQLGLDTSSKASKKDAERVNGFRRLVDQQIMSLQEKTGKKATNDDVRGIVDSLMVETVTEKGIFWDTKKRVYELSEQDVPQIDVKSIPKYERQKIEQALKRRGLPATDDRILELFTQKARKVSAN